MPNVKIYVDEAVFEARRDHLDAFLSDLRNEICRALSVPVGACQLVVLPVHGMSDQPLANMEIQYLAQADRTPEMITEACAGFRAIAAKALDTHTAVRATPLVPATYVALK